MNKHSYVVGLMTIVALTGCGKSLKITPQGQAVVTQTKVEFSKRRAREAAEKKAADLVAKHESIVSLQDTSGKLTILSDLDVTQVNGQLPYVDQADPFQDIGYPSLSVKNLGGNGVAPSSDGFIIQSNLVFRAIVQLPPEANKNAITAVNAITLKLRGVTLNTDGNVSSASLADQVLCFFESKKCIGKLDTDAKTNLNQTYLSDINASFSQISDFEAIHTINQDDVNESKVFSYTGAAKSGPAELDLDLKALLGLSNTSDAISWLYKNSVEFDTQSNFRKFRFSLGNNIYAAEGELVVDVTTDKTQLSKVADVSVVTPKDNSDATRLIVALSANATEVKDVIESADEGELALDSTGTTLTSGSIDKLTSFAKGLTAQSTAIKELIIIARYDLSNTTGEDKAAALALGKAISDELIALKVPKTFKITLGSHQAVQSSCAPTLECSADRGVEFRVNLKNNITTSDKDPIKVALKASLGGIFKDDSSAIRAQAQAALAPSSAAAVTSSSSAASTADADSADCN